MHLSNKIFVDSSITPGTEIVALLRNAIGAHYDVKEGDPRAENTYPDPLIVISEKGKPTPVLRLILL